MKDLDEKRQGNSKFEMIRVKETTMPKKEETKQNECSN